ncbi:hypothetical protein [Demequina flava]|uniref:hypothetical protein n=1 Tax=Demequina flava TaxID=1095025 RepID=UPI000A408E27|nr:hypothetical protein [Demequina flava]
MELRKALALPATVLLAGSLLAGCGDSSSDTSDDSTMDTEMESTMESTMDSEG